MASETAPGSQAGRLAHYLLDGRREDPLADELTAWLSGSPRFRAFADAHRDKIRKKLRGASDADARRDVRAELGAARLLLADRRMDLAFEAYGSGRAGPDFTIGFRGERRFNLEVTRLHARPDGTGFAAALPGKLHQLPPSVPNVLLVALEAQSAGALDVAEAVRLLRARADAKDEPFFRARGFDGSRGFYERFLRLSAVLVWCETATGDDRAVAWPNRSARIALPERVGRACLSCLRAG